MSCVTQRENRRKLIEALESGKYIKNKSCLRQGNTYCCLGVALDLLYPAGWIDNFDQPMSHVFGTHNSMGAAARYIEEQKFYLTHEVITQFGFTHRNQKELSLLNDECDGWEEVIHYLKNIDQLS